MSERIAGLPYEFVYIVHSVYEMSSFDNDGFELHKDTGVPSDFPLTNSEIYDMSYDIDSEFLEFAGEGSRGKVIRVLSREIVRTLQKE